jgi:hypothetical protein
MGKIPSAVLAATLLLSGAGQALAAHANPWAGPEDNVLGAMHDTNQARSVDTPGEDEMNGAMTRSATGKTGDDGIASGGGTGPGAAGGGQGRGGPGFGK